MAAGEQTIGQTIDSTRQHLLGNGRSEMNALSVAMTDTTTGTCTTSYPVGGITPGVYISIEEEEMYVFTTSPGTKTITMSRGENGTTAHTHPINARIFVNEPFTRNMILNAICDDIKSWGPQVYAVKNMDITTSPYVRGYDLGSINPYYGVMEVTITPAPTYNNFDNKDWKRVRFRDYQQANTTDFPSGNALVVSGVGGMQGGDIPLWQVNGVQTTLHVIYTAPFNVDAITSSATPETIRLGADVGLDESEFDIPSIGAAWRLMMAREARRATTHMQDEPRSAEEVPPMYISKMAEQFKMLRDGRLADAQYRLMRQYPTRMSS